MTYCHARHCSQPGDEHTLYCDVHWAEVSQSKRGCLLQLRQAEAYDERRPSRRWLALLRSVADDIEEGGNGVPSWRR